MTDDPIKAAEARGYGRGYAAGKRRKEAENFRARRQAKLDAFWQRAFLAVLPTAMEVQGWKMGDEAITTGEQRAKLAAAWANRALYQAQSDGKL